MPAQKNIVDLYVERASEEERSAETRSREPRIYGGTMPDALEQFDSGEFASARNRRTKSRKVSPFTIMLMLIGAAIVIVLYISNIIAIGQLLNQINLLQTRYHRILNDQEMLKVQISRLSSLERIRKIAEEELNLQYPKEPPVWIEIDAERVQELNETVQKTQQIQGKK